MSTTDLTSPHHSVPNEIFTSSMPQSLSPSYGWGGGGGGAEGSLWRVLPLTSPLTSETLLRLEKNAVTQCCCEFIPQGGRKRIGCVWLFPFKRRPSVKHPHSLRLCFETIQNYYPLSLHALSTCLDRIFVIWLSFKSLLEMPIFCWQGLLYTGVQRGETDRKSDPEKIQLPRAWVTIPHNLHSQVEILLGSH